MMEDIRDIRAPIETPMWVWVLVAVILCAILAVVIYWALNRRKSTPIMPLVPMRRPWEIAFERLETLRSKKYPESGQFKIYYGELTGIVRHYLEDRFTIKAPEMTTEEFLLHLKSTAVLADEHKAALKDFMNLSDMVKFAKHEPTVNDAVAGFELAKKLIASTQDGI